jgi:hypothetical protein
VPDLLNDPFTGSGALNAQSFSIDISNSMYTIGANGVFQNDGTVTGTIKGGDCDAGRISPYTAVMGATCIPTDGNG